MAEEIMGDADEAGEAQVQGDTILTGESESVAEAAAKAVEEEEAAAKADSESTDHDTDKKTEDGSADKVEDGAPAEYADFKMPEGMDVDADALDAAIPLFKEMNASQEAAQKVVDVASTLVEKVMAKQQTEWTDRVAKWTKESENDEEYGGADYDKNIMKARSAMRKIGGPKLAETLEELGAGNNPEIIRVFVRLGNAIGEDNLNFGSVNPAGSKSLAERLFPNQGKEAA